LDVERLSQLKVLLLGAGTLGCSVARTLLGWGVRNISFVDSGRVSYSNPVRQSLFGIEDCKEGGKYKAVAAADSLVAIAGPDVKSEGIVLTIPMPGHAFGGGKDAAAEIDAVRKDVERLHELIEQSDAVFLLTDTRESRWLPTVIALATDTPLINSALGLDSWLVMRHGPSALSLSSTVTTPDSQKLGCYFCSDVVAPENSTRDRTLDQQCTVTRPGLAPIAASMATELMVALFHHPLGNCAPAPEKKYCNASTYSPVDDGSSASSTALGLLPHQIRGTVVTYTMMTPTVPAFPSCTACSELVVNEYKKGRFDFVKCVCCDMDGSYLEAVSGLAKFREDMDGMMDWDDEEDELI
jgi:ubiquitin-like modifier-activating enzyme ATG7